MTGITYLISDLAREFDVTHRAIRHYETLGLLNPQRQGQTRLYSPADRTRLKLIVRGKRLGLSLAESSQIINMYEPGQRNEAQLHTLIGAIRDQRRRLRAQLDDIHKLSLELDTAEAECLSALATLPLSPTQEPTP